MNEQTVTFLNAMLDDCMHKRRPLCTVVARIMWCMPCQVRGQVLDHIFGGSRLAVVKGEIDWT